MKRRILLILEKLLPSYKAYAHCDVPCGIYDPTPAKIAAATVKRMIEKIDELPQDQKLWTIENRANFIRYVQTKEEHADICKKELLILWTDYFKAEHLTNYPDLHNIFWQAAKLCSDNKQHISKDSAEKLVQTVNVIAEMFHKVKAIKK